MNDPLRTALIATIEDPIDRKFEEMMALKEECKKLIDEVCNDNEADEIDRKVRLTLKLLYEIQELIVDRDGDDEPVSEKFKLMITARSNEITTSFFMNESTEEQFADYQERWIKGENLDSIIHDAVSKAYADPEDFQCGDCGKNFKKWSQDDNEKICLRCEANFIAQKNYDRESGHNDRDE